MPLIHLMSIDDPALDPFRCLKSTNRTRWSGQFITEGKKLTVQLLHSDFHISSVLLSEKYVDFLAPHIRPDLPAFVLPQSLAELLVGFKFHCGVMGCAYRKPALKVEDVVPSTGRAKLVVCPKIENPDNLGSILRLSAGFGVDAILLGHGSCDPFSRRTLRVSMGAGLRLSIIESGKDLRSQLAWLRDEWDIELIATVLDERAIPLPQASVPDRCAVLLGNEETGLTTEWIELCSQCVTIPMHAGTDSLNVALAAGIFLFHFAGR